MDLPKGARKWTRDDICKDSAQARNIFRESRLKEGQSAYKDAYKKARTVAAEAVIALSTLADESLGGEARSECVLKLMTRRVKKEALRYLTAPPISEDDIATLADIPSFTSNSIRAKEGSSLRIASIIKNAVDPFRFPWIIDGSLEPSEKQLAGAIDATAILIATQNTQTQRRSNEKKHLEGAVESVFRDAGYIKVATPKTGIRSISDFPEKRQYMIGCTILEDNGDVVARLDDGRLLIIECKASNSEINSRKRLNKEAVKNVLNWRRGFGEATVVGAAAIRGVFRPCYVEEAQNQGVVIFWGHRLSDISAVIGVPPAPGSS